jgi:outer membrane receptor protein involved in Fe transport
VAEALAAFGRQTGLQLIYVSVIAETQQSKGARAGLTASEALTQLLDGTGLRFEFLNTRTVRIFPAPQVVPTAVAALPSSPHTTERRVDSRAFALEEVVVTATWREEQASRVPIDMAVWTQDAMEASGVKGMAQIGALTPGVDFGFQSTRGGDDYTHLVIRGVGNRHGSTVGIYLDDTSIPPARAATYLRSFSTTFDLDRVEVLRGPQGTLLGDHTQGGAIRFIMNQPSLTTFSGLARIEWATTAHGAMSLEVGAAAGGPLITDVLGFRVSGWYRTDGGYVDRVDPFTLATVDANSNRYGSKTVRLALMFAPDAAVRITPSLIYQSTRIRDTSTFYPTLSNPADGQFRNGSLVQQPFSDTLYLASCKLTAGLRVGDLSAVTSYFDRTATATLDWTGPPQPISYADAQMRDYALRQKVFSQEVRLTSTNPNEALSWITGVFFSSEHTRHPHRTVASGLTDFGDATVTQQSEVAGFAQIALKVTERLTGSAGLRIGRSKYDSVTEAPPIFHAAAADTWMTPRFVLSYQADERNLFYLTAAKGYGSGGVYPGIDSPGPYPPDTLWSYEIGSKNDLLNGRLHLDASIFHIHWNNGGPDYNLVGEIDPVPGTADSDGFDVAIQALVTERIRVGLGIAYTDARYTQTLKVGDAVFVRKGDAVGGSPWSVTASIERDFPLRGGVTASVRAEDVFHSHNPGPLYSENPDSPFYFPFPTDPATNVLNARVDVRWSDFDVAALVSNALDSHPTLVIDQGVAGPAALTLTPRTVGLSGTWRF